MTGNDLLILILQGLAGGAVTAVVVAGFRRLLPRIPRVALPFLAVLLGSGASWLTAYATGTALSPALVALCSLGAGWLRELLSTAQEHGLNP